MHPSVDDVYLDALLSVLGNQDDQSRRIGRAIDWLDLSWRNTSSIDEDTRIRGPCVLASRFCLVLGTRLGIYARP